MRLPFSRVFLYSILPFTAYAWAQQPNSCDSLKDVRAPHVEITKATTIAAGTTEPNPYGGGHSAALPAYCRVEGVINRRTGVDAEEFGIRFVLAMPDKWEPRFSYAGRWWQQRCCDAAAWHKRRGEHAWADAGIRGRQEGYRCTGSQMRIDFEGMKYPKCDKLSNPGSCALLRHVPDLSSLTAATIQHAECTCLKCGEGFVIENNIAKRLPSRKRPQKSL